MSSGLLCEELTCREYARREFFNEKHSQKRYFCYKHFVTAQSLAAVLGDKVISRELTNDDHKNISQRPKAKI